MAECSFSSATVQWNATPDKWVGPEFWELDDISLAALDHMTNFKAAWENLRDAAVWSPGADLSKHVFVFSRTIAPLTAPRGAGIALLDASWGWGAPVEVLRPISQVFAQRVMRGRPHCCLQFPLVVRHLTPPGGAMRGVHIPQTEVPDLRNLQASYEPYTPGTEPELINDTLSDRLIPIGALLGVPTHVLLGYKDGTPFGWEAIESLGRLGVRWVTREGRQLMGLQGAAVSTIELSSPDAAEIEKVHSLASFHADSVLVSQGAAENK